MAEPTAGASLFSGFPRSPVANKKGESALLVYAAVPCTTVLKKKKC